MTVRINLRFENGVFIPESPVSLPEHHRLTLTYEDTPAPAKRQLPRWDDPSDPMPKGGVELVDWWARHRIQIDPAIAREIAEDPEFDIENS